MNIVKLILREIPIEVDEMYECQWTAKLLMRCWILVASGWEPNSTITKAEIDYREQEGVYYGQGKMHWEELRE